MKKLSMVLGLVLSISSVSNAFCLKQYSKQMNRFTASMANQKNNFAQVIQTASAAPVEQTPVHRQK
jgi:hypothetical protein